MATGPRQRAPQRDRRARNLALMAALVGFVVLVFLVTIYKMGGL